MELSERTDSSMEYSPVERVPPRDLGEIEMLERLADNIVRANAGVDIAKVPKDVINGIPEHVLHRVNATMQDILEPLRGSRPVQGAFKPTPFLLWSAIQLDVARRKQDLGSIAAPGEV